jgi:FtsP/CotA-like multicopper oxidase with cupredoxin domain
MTTRKFLNTIISILVIISVTISGNIKVSAQGALPNGNNPPPPHLKKGKVTPKDRKDAANNRQAQMLAAGVTSSSPTLVTNAAGALIPDYFGSAPNWAFSPLPTVDPIAGTVTGGVRKFVDTLPGLGAANANNLGQYLPVAVPDTTTYPGDDYYEIELGQYTEQLHSDLLPTTLRGYRQTNMGGTPFSYLGPIIVALRDRPVRVKFTNSLPTGTGGDLFIPVDTTIMGAGMGPDGVNMYTQNRATLHLHGGNTPWISDGTQHQWITPATEVTAYPEGVSVENVPDMAAAGCDAPTDGCQTFYYTNQQSARLLFYHDHAYGITRLNVYAGEAAGYVVTDSAEQDLISTGVLPDVGIPLVIQDKTFIDPNTVLTTDPTWPIAVNPTLSDLWLPHVYMPNQNPYDITGANAMGRWDYGPWFWPPFTGITNGTIANPYCLPTPGVDCSATPWEPPFIPGTPNPSIVPEAFMDTPLVNGTAYPTLTVDPKSYRFRILNAANDRYWNLSLWVADGTTVYPLGYAGATNTEVKMVPFNSSQNLVTPFPGWWYTSGNPFSLDDRAGGVPDPSTRGPAMIQIGTEAGFMPAPVVINNQPVNYDYNRKSITVLNVLQHALFLGPAERADVLVDFSNFAGQTLILYSDSPAPVPAGDSRVDYFTGNPDQTAMGGAPSTVAGYGPNTRTIMQIVVTGSGGTAPVDDYNPSAFATLQTALASAYAASQPKPIVPNAVYNQAFGANYPVDSYVRIQDTQASFQGDAVTSLNLTNGGGGYTSAPIVSLSGGGGSGASATATLGPAAVASLTLTNGGSGYTSAPAVSLTGGGGTGATATAVLAATGSVKSVSINASGSKYSSVPTVTFSAPLAPGVRATGTATIGNGGKVTGVIITNPGSNYTIAPTITFTGGGGSGAAATAILSRVVASLSLTNGGAGYTSAPTVSFSGGGGSGAAATATLATRVVASLTLTGGGFGYISAPAVSFSGGGGSGTVAAAVVGKVTISMQPKAIQELFDPEYGRMNALLGVEISNTTGINQTTIPYADIDPPTEVLTNSISGTAIGTLGDGTQIWKITHNGVDTHAIHWHMFDVQVINRVGWDGAVKPPDANEIGWKDTVRMNPLEDVIVAIRPIVPTVPFGLPNSIRPLDPSMPTGADLRIGAQTAGLVDPLNNPVTVPNQLINYGYEMRSVLVANFPAAPSSVVATLTGSGNNQGATLTWVDNSTNETGWIIQKGTSPTGPWTTVGTVQIALVKDAGYTTGGTNSFNVTGLAKGGKTYYFQVLATNVVGLTQTFAAPAVGFPTATANSQPALSNSITTK